MSERIKSGISPFYTSGRFAIKWNNFIPKNISDEHNINRKNCGTDMVVTWNISANGSILITANWIINGNPNAIINSFEVKLFLNNTTLLCDTHKSIKTND